MRAPDETAVRFGHLPISFDRRVLRPREWTVTQSIWAAELLRQEPRSASVLELCAGAGQIGLLTLALLAPSRHRLVAVDINPAACAFVRRNATAADLEDQVEVREGSLDEVLGDGERYALVIADPPWVERDRVPMFPDDPKIAIDGGIDGLDLAIRCIDIADKHLIVGGSLLLQVGSQSQVEAIEVDLQRRWPTLSIVEVWHEAGSGALVHLRKRGPE